VHVPSELPQPGMDYHSTVRVRSARVKGECQVTKDIGKTNFCNAKFNNPDTKNNHTIPVIVKGQALTSKSNPIKSLSSKSFHRNDHKVLIIGDSHTRLCATNVKAEIKDKYDVQGLVKPGAEAGILANTANSDITNLTKNNVVIFCGGANDIAKKNSKMALRHIRNFIKSNNHTNIISVSVPYRYDLMQSSCVNNEIRSFNIKLTKSVRAYQHTSILEMVSDRKLFTNHGLHLNGLGKEMLPKQTVSLTYAILDQKKDPPIILSWNSDISHTDILHQGKIINRTSTRTKKAPLTKSDVLRQTQALMWKTMLTLNSYAKKKDANYYKVNQINKGTVYFKTFHQNIRGTGKKAGEL